jgi:metallo-beta-lactamase family protein
MSLNTENPWLPDDAGETFDPLQHFDVELDEETPIAITTRGGGREVGRSCYQVNTRCGQYLVDCGLNQGSGGQFPDFRGLDQESIDAVFLTHAHIDHSGALPVIENRGYLKDDAPIIATPPTTQLAQTLLDDSLKIHKQETRNSPQGQQFTKEDVTAVYERFKPLHYGQYPLNDFVDTADGEPMQIEIGNAAHLLGSAWFSMSVDGYRTVFSGDLGGRMTHLDKIATPPEADHLVLESTYGSLHSHPSITDARTELFEAVSHAVERNKPVLIPTFAVGRAQMLTLLLAERYSSLPGDGADINIILDGMAQEATQIYKTHISDNRYYDESIVNRVENGSKHILEPPEIHRPDSDADRRQVLDNFSPESETGVPVIIAPSGMLTGGNSPRYLAELVTRYDDAQVILTGYQAVGTTGRAIQNAKQAGEQEVGIEVDANPLEADWKASDKVVWKTNEDGEQVTRVKFPTEWAKTIEGLSGHASQHNLLSFARDVRPETVSLVHGPAYAQEDLSQFLINNVDSTSEITRSRLLTPIEVTYDPDIKSASLEQETIENKGHQDFEKMFEDVHESLAMMNKSVSEVKQNAITTESEVKAIMREVLEDMELK